MDTGTRTAAVECACGRIVRVTLQAAGTVVRCQCGAPLEVPSLSVLEEALRTGATLPAANKKPRAKSSPREPGGFAFQVHTAEANRRVSVHGLQDYFMAVFRRLSEGDLVLQAGVQVDLAMLPGGKLLVEAQDASQDLDALDRLQDELREQLAAIRQPHVESPVSVSFEFVPASAHQKVTWRIPFQRTFGGLVGEALERSLAERCEGPIESYQAPTTDKESRGGLLGLFRSARRWLARRRAGDPCAVTAQFDAHYNASDSEQWLQLLNGHLTERPECASAHARRGRLHIDRGDFPKAIADLKRSCELDQEEEEYKQLFLGIAYARSQQIENALGEFNLLLLRYPRNAEGLVERSRLHAQMKDWPAALADMRRALEVEPLSYNLRLLAAQFLHASGDTPGSLAELKVAIALNPNDERGYLMRGTVLMPPRTPADQRQALDDFSRVVEVEPKNPHGYLSRAQLRASLGNLLEARDDCDKALALDPTLTDGYSLRGEIRGSLGDYQGGLSDCDRALRMNESAVGYARRGMAQLHLEKLDEASDDFKSALKIDPDNPVAHRGEGLLRLKAGEGEDALVAFSLAIKHAPTWALLYVDRGNARRLLKDDEAAMTDFTEAIRLDSTLVEAYLSRGMLHEAEDQTRLAWNDFCSAVEASPNDPRAALLRAKIAINAGDWETASADLDRVFRLHRAQTEHRFYRGVVRLQLDDAEGAIDDFSKVIDEQPSFADGWFCRALARLRLGQASLAEDDFLEAIRAEPGKAESFELRRLVEESRHLHVQERYDEALVKADEALKLDPKSAAAHSARGVCFWYRGEFVDAVEEYNRILEADEDAFMALQNRGQLLAEMGEGEQALTDLERTERLLAHRYCPPKHLGYIYSGKGLAKAVLGRAEEAMRDYEHSIALFAENVWVYYRMGLLYHQQGQKREAAMCIHLALHLSEPPLPPFHRRRAVKFLEAWGYPSKEEA